MEAAEEKIVVLEDEVKILKAELKETLTSVRDFLLTVRPLPGENGTVINNNYEQNFGGGPGGMSDGMDDQSLDMNNKDPLADIEGDITDSETESQDESDVSESEMSCDASDDDMDLLSELEGIETGDECDDDMWFDDMDLLEEGGSMKGIERGMYQSNSQVNLLANLVHWVSVAKKDIGCDRLSGFLDVYGVSRRLPVGLKEFILYLADTLEETSSDNLADSWTRLTLELQGILAGGTPFHSPEAFITHRDDEESEEEDSEPQRVTTKWVEVNKMEKVKVKK